MEMTLNNNFIQLTDQEINFIDGGDFWRNLGYAGASTCCVCACIATGGGAIAAAGAAAAWYWYDATR